LYAHFTRPSAPRVRERAPPQTFPSHNHSPTMPTLPKTTRTELSIFQKTVVPAQYPVLKSSRTVAANIDRPYETVRDFLHRVDARLSIHNAKRTGRPPSLNRAQKRYIQREARKDYAHRRQPLREFRNENAPQVSVDTVRRALKEVNIKKHLPVKKP